MAKIAFDCKGTLLSDNPRVLQLWKWFESKGCDMYIWSNSFGYVEDAVRIHDLNNAQQQMKDFKFDIEQEEWMDVCVDDDSQSIEILASNNFILVSDIPDEEKFEETYGHLV